MSKFVRRHWAASFTAGVSWAVLTGRAFFYLKQCRNADRRIKQAEERAASAISELRELEQLLQSKVIENGGRLRH